MVKSHIVSHTHWDREWYFSTMDSLVLSEQLFADVLDELETNKDANFCLDGQSSIIDNYLEVHPEQTELVKELIKQERLYIGPWYTQSDCLLINEESILRNLMIGIKDCKKYGDYMHVGYLPDTFGFNAQMPMLVSQVGIDNIIFWRGIDFEKKNLSPYFKWKSLGTKEIYAANITQGYSLAAHINSSSDFVGKRLEPAIDFLSDKSGQGEVLIPAGGDQLNIVKNIDQIVKEINNKSQYDNILSSYPQFIDSLKKMDNLQIYTGEFREPVYTRLHRTIGSVRSSIKVENFKLEQKLLKRVEPLLVIAKKMGIHISNELLIKTWKKILESQAHDSIAGCVTDSVAMDIHHRLKEANELCDGIENTIVKKIFQGANLTSNEVLLFNTGMKPYKGYKEFTILVEDKKVTFKDIDEAIVIDEKFFPERKNVLMLSKDGYTYKDEPSYYQLKIKAWVKIPALGYTTLNIVKSDKELEKAVESELKCIKNEYHNIAFRDNKIVYQNNQITMGNIISLVDSGNDGDTYDYSPLPNDQEIELPFHEVSVLQSTVEEIMKVRGYADLPITLEDRKKSNGQTKKCEYQLEITLEKNNPLVKVSLLFDNQVESHRLRVKCHMVNNSDVSIAQIQGGFMTHQNEIIDKDWQNKYVEKPVNIFNFQKSISIEDEKSCFHFFSKGMLEYEKLDSDLFVTIASTTGELGKPDLCWRPGRASGDTTMKGHVMIGTPMAQEMGMIKSEFAIGFTKTFDEAKTYALSENFLQQSISYQGQEYNCFINRIDNRLQLQPAKRKLDTSFTNGQLLDEVFVNAIYPSYYDLESYIVRLINPTKNTIKLCNKLLNAEYTFVNALEEKVEVTNEILPYDMVTLKVKYK